MSHARQTRFPSADQVAPDLLAAFRDLPAAILSDNLDGLRGTVNLKPFHRPGRRMAGTAVTVRVRQGDNLVLHRALDYVRPGDVVVVDAGGFAGQAITGKIMIRYLETIGAAGIVVDGAIRGGDEIGQRDFPAFARGLTPRGPYKSGPGEINVPVVIDGMPVRPGDLVVGDGDGVVAFSPDEAPAVRERAQAQLAKEVQNVADVLAGRWDRSWIIEAERKQGLAD